MTSKMTLVVKTVDEAKPVRCRICGDPPVAVYRLERGCVCYPDDREQALCPQHAVRSEPLGDMDMIKDLTVGQAWTRHWEEK
jgi:hypothetical protein